MRNRKLLTHRAASARLTTAEAGTPAAGPVAAIRVEEADGREAVAADGREAAAVWAVEAWAAGEDNRPIAEAP